MFKVIKIFAFSLLTFLLTFLLPTVARAQVLENEILIQPNQDTLATEFVSQQNPQLTVISSNPIKAEIHLIGEMILFSSEETTNSEMVTLNFSGFIPETIYHFYLDEYHQHYTLESNQEGRIDFQLDTNSPHTLIIQNHPSTKFIKNDATGGDCLTIGTWNYSAKTCTLTGDVSETIQIDANNIVIDGNGYSIIGSNTGNGIYSYNKQYVTIKNLVVKNFANGIYFNLGSYNQVIDNEVKENEVGLRFYSSNYNQILRNKANDNRLTGIWIQKSSNNILTQNQAEGNGTTATAYTNDAYGIFIYDSPQNILTQNIMNDNYMNFALFSWNVAYLSQTIDQTNLVEGKPVVYLRNATNQVIDSASNAGTVYCIQCQNMTFKDLSFADEFAGVYLHQNQNSTVENISFKNGYLGVYDQYSMGNKVQDSQMENGYYGVLVVPVGGCSTGTCQYAKIENNHISNCDRGIYFNHYYVTLYGNYLEKNKVGVFAYGSYALIRNNTFTENDLGIQFRFFNDNKMYNNNFIDNIVQTAIDNTRNPVFNLGIPTGGNYWSNWFTPNSNGDNFVDSPYELATGYFDYLPWVVPNGWLPVTTAFPTGDMGEGGWYRSDVTITLQGEDNEGIDRIEYSFNNNDWIVYIEPIIISNETESSLYYHSIDIVGDKEKTKSLTVKIDKNPPEIVLTNPLDGAIYFKDQQTISQWSASDNLSGLKSATASVDNGQPIDTSTTGLKEFEITAEDFAGNKTTQKINYSVIYFYSSLFDENKKHNQGYKAGSALPVKFDIQAEGMDFGQIEAKLYLAPVINGIVGDKIPAISKGKANDENIFRYSDSENQFIFNLDTKGLSSGIWQLIIEFNFGTFVSTEIEIR